MILFLFACISFNTNAQSISGKVYDADGSILPYVNIQVKNSTIGTTTNNEGLFKLNLKPGNYTIIFSFVGYLAYEHELRISGNRNIQLDVTLQTLDKVLNEVLISADQKELARSIMRNLRNNRKNFLDAVQSYETEYYRKASLQSDVAVKLKLDTLQTDSISEDITINEDFKTVTSALFETYNKVYFEAPSKYKEIIIAENDYEANPQYNSLTVGFSLGHRGLDINSLQRNSRDPYILVYDAASADFNFFKNTLHLPLIADKPFLSPLANTATLNYSFDYHGMFYQDDKKIFIIKIEPIFKNDALFSGLVYVEDSTWFLNKVDLNFNRAALNYCSELRIIQDYNIIDNQFVVPEKTELIYKINEGRKTIEGNIFIEYFNRKINVEIPRSKFSNEIIRYNSDATEKDSVFWTNIRPYEFSNYEKEFAKKKDSLKNHYSSPEYIHKLDSSFNNINFWSFIYKGVGYRNRLAGYEFYFDPLVSQINPFGVGGYRHKLGGRYKKRYKNDYLLETEGFVDYGFLNKDARGKVGVGLTYIPERFVRTFIRYGDHYDMINDYASIISTFSRSNYVRTKGFSIAQRMEIVNGLFGEITFSYSNQTPITGMTLETWSSIIFGELNTPSDFNPYTKFDINLELKYRINQQYIMKGRRKILLDSNWPELSFKYRKGIPKLFSSEVNFDFIEFGIHHDMKLSRWGTSGGNMLFGSFVNKKNLRIIEHKYFRGSDILIFSNPLESFQLLGPTLSSSSTYFRFNYIHHFDGAILDKIPLISKLKISPAAGAGALLMTENNFKHIEVFAGIERRFRIRKELFRIGIYAVTADNTLSKPTITYKVGLNFFNTYSQKWDY